MSIQASARPLAPADAPYYNLGRYNRPITTSSRDAQIWFNRGLVWSYGFNHVEASACFEKAIAHDPNCAMAYWGLAYSLGPNYNKPWEIFDKDDLIATLQRTHDAAQQAQRLASRARPVEQALINAIQARYPGSQIVDDWAERNEAYVEAMEVAYQQFSGDLDVAALFADALMILTPWSLWDIHTGSVGKGARTKEVMAVFEKSWHIEGAKRHPGLLHFYIHLYEMSVIPEAGIKMADHLRGLCPDAGHLQHMPSHLYVLVGDYQQAIASNADAVRADEEYLARDGGMNFYTIYRTHNYHFLIYAAMFAGQEQIAMSMLARMEASIPDELLRQRSPPMADWLETFKAVRPHVLIRFGRWKELQELSLPEDQELYCVTTAAIRYGKGVAYAATGDVANAEQQQLLFEAAYARVPESRLDFANKCIDILAIAGEMLAGELEYRKGNVDLAFRHLSRSVELEDGLSYQEPWAWMQPTRHAFAALTLEQGRVEEAANMYRADLGLDDTLPRARQHPNNVWALHGLHECLVRLGRHTEADEIEDRLKQARAFADVDVSSSCYCRNVTAADQKRSTAEPACCKSTVLEHKVLSKV